MRVPTYIIGFVLPALLLWAVQSFLLFGQSPIEQNTITPAPASLEATYLSNADTDLFDQLVVLDCITSDTGQATVSLPRLLLLYLLFSSSCFLSATLYSARGQGIAFISSYVRNVFYVFVTALAP